MSAEEGLLSFGKSAAVSVGTKFIPGANLGTGFAANMAEGVLDQVVDNALAGTINGFNFDEDGTFGWDGNVLANSMFGEGAMAGYLSGAAATGVTEAFDSTSTGFYEDTYANAHDLHSVAGAAASAGITWSMTGHASINILNTSMFGAENGTGLFELHFDKDKGMTGAIGMGGVDMNLGKLARGVKGMDAWAQNVKIWSSKEENISDAAVQMRVAYSAGKSGDTEAMSTYRNLLSGKDNLFVGLDKGEGYTETNAGGGRDIYLSSLGTDKNSRLASGVTLVHESHRDGEDSKDNYLETRETVAAHTIAAFGLSGTYGTDFIKGNETLTNDVNAFMKGPAGFADYVDGNYDSNGDNWLLTKHNDGSFTMIDDGSDDVTVFDEATGTTEFFDYTGGSRTEFIGESIGITRDEVIKQMGPGSGWTYADGDWGNNRENQTVAFTPYQTDRINARFAGLFPEANTVAVAEPGFFEKIGQSLGSVAASLYNGVQDYLFPSVQPNIGTLDGSQTEIFMDHMAGFGIKDVLKYRDGENDDKTYDCADTYLQAYRDSYAIATGDVSVWAQFSHNGGTLDKLINIQAKDFLNPENTYFFGMPTNGEPTDPMSYVDGQVDNLFNSPNLQIGMAAVFSLLEGVNSVATGHVAYVQDFTRSDNGDVDWIKLFEGHMSDTPGTVDIYSQDDLDLYERLFQLEGWAYPRF